MATVGIVTRPSKRSDNQVPLYVRVSHKGIKRYVSLSLHVKESDWNSNRQEIRKSHPEWAKLNRHLSSVHQKAQSVLTELVASDAPMAADRLQTRVGERLNGDANNSPDFLTYCRDRLKEYRARDQFGTFKTYRAVVNKFETYIQKKHNRAALPFHQIDVPLMRGFQTFMHEYYDNAQNTVYKGMKTMRTMLYSAIKDGHFPQEKNPFFHIELKQKKVRKEKLSYDEIKAIESLELDPDSLTRDVRNWFLFSFYAGGLRFGDTATLCYEHVRREGDQYRLAYDMDKTGDPAGTILAPPAVDILRRYWKEGAAHDDRILNILDGYDLSTPVKRRKAIESRNTLTNKYLRKLQRRANIDRRISFHLARHSLADYLRREAGRSARRRE